MPRAALHEAGRHAYAWTMREIELRAQLDALGSTVERHRDG